MPDVKKSRLNQSISLSITAPDSSVDHYSRDDTRDNWLEKQSKPNKTHNSYLKMSQRRRVIGTAGEPARVRFVLKTPDISVIDFAELLKSMTPAMAIHPLQEAQNQNRILREEYRQVSFHIFHDSWILFLIRSQAQSLMAEGNIKECHQVCIDLINAPHLPIDLKIETIHIMSTLVPLDQALFFLEDALRLAGNKTREEPNDLLWLGLLTTTRDQMWKIHKIKGAIKFHREITFGDPIAGKLLYLWI